jgi:hypothetical protein
MEVLCRYLNMRLKGEQVTINVVRSRAIKTQTMENTFGKELEDFVRAFIPTAIGSKRKRWQMPL